MLQQIIDRRLSGKNKSVGNRERFLRRHKTQIREAVRRAVDGRGIRDLEKGEDVHIPKRDLSQPVFGHGQGGKREAVHPGNSEYVTGDRVKRPDGGGGGGSGSGQASDSGEGEDDFVFHLTKEEFMQAFFDDLALPNLTRTQLAEIPEYKSHRAGFVNDGTPSNLSIVRSMRGALGRRIALSADSRGELREAEAALALLEEQGAQDVVSLKQKADLLERIKHLKGHIARVPFLDPLDLKFRNRVKVPVPSTRAVMFCVMDVSGSMDESRKDLAKRFFILLYLFLTRHYDKIEVVFIRHHTQAAEVDEQNFFHATETGGTVVSSALVLMDEIIRARYRATSGTSTARRPATATTGTTTAAAAASCWSRRSCPSAATSPTCRWPSPSRTCGRNTSASSARCRTSRCARRSRRRRSIRCSANCSARKGRTA